MDLKLAECTKPATVAIEVYSPRQSLHGSLDAMVYTCDEHRQVAVDQIHAVNLTPHQRQRESGAVGRPCGRIFNYTTLRTTPKT